MVWKEMLVKKIPRWLLSAWPSLMCEWDVFAISESPLCHKPSMKFLLKGIYGLERDVS